MISDKQIDWKPLAVLKFAIGGILALVGLMGGIEATKNLWSIIGVPNVHFYIIAKLLLWAIGNGALFLIGLLYFQQGQILLKPIHSKLDSEKINTSAKRANLLIVLTMIVAIVLLIMFYVSTKEYLEIIRRFYN